MDRPAHLPLLIRALAEPGPRLAAFERAAALAREWLGPALLALVFRPDPLAEFVLTAGPRPGLEARLSACLQELDEGGAPGVRPPVAVDGLSVVAWAGPDGYCPAAAVLDPSAGAPDPAAVEALVALAGLAADRAALDSGVDLLRRSLELQNEIYGRALEGRTDRRALGWAFGRLRALVGYDVCALAVPAEGGWKAVVRLPPAASPGLLEGAKTELFDVLLREHGVRREAVAVEYVYEDVPGAGSRFAAEVGSSVILPLVAASGRAPGGLMAFFSGSPGFFTSAGLRLLGLLSPGLTVAMRGGEVLQELEDANVGLQRSRQVLEQQIDTAAQIQASLMPDAPPAVPGFLVAQRHRQAKRVGGDFFAYHLGEGGTLAVALADVAGKGLPAAMLASFSLGALRVVWAETREPAEVLDRLDRHFGASLDPFRFVTMACLLFRPGRLVYATAGHEPVLRVRAGEAPLELATTGLPLGVRPGGGYGRGEVDLAPGDLVVAYTDGLSEARAKGVLFGRARLVDLLAARAGSGAAETVEAMFAAVGAFLEGHEQSDDQTAVAVRAL